MCQNASQISASLNSGQQVRLRASSLQLAFGFQTALHVLRSLERESVDGRRLCRAVASDARIAAANRDSASLLPCGVPPREELARALDRLRMAHPGLELDEPAHLLIGSGSRCRPSRIAISHLCRAKIPRRSFYRLDANTVYAAPNLALCQIASGIRDPIRLLMLIWEACGSYATPITGSSSFAETAFDMPALSSVRSLGAFCSGNSFLNGAAKISRVLRYAADGSASPRETGLALLLGLPERYGGYNLGIPLMNHEVDASREARRLSGRRSFRLDLCWPEARIDLEYQSACWHRGEEAHIGDSRRANALRSMGWNVIGVTGLEAERLPAIDTIANTVRRDLGKRSRPVTVQLHERRMRLRRMLGLM